MFTKSDFHLVSILTLTIGAGHLVGCGDSGLVQGSAQVDRIGQSSQIPMANFVSVDGTYGATCLDPTRMSTFHAATDKWSAGLPTRTASEPVVVKNDPNGCTLTFAQLTVIDSKGSTVKATTASPMTLTANYGAAVVFTYTDSALGMLSFYATAKQTMPAWTADFDISVIYSDSPDPVSKITLTGQYSTVTSHTVQATNVPAPDYVLDFAPAMNPVVYTKAGTGKVDFTMYDPVFTAGNTAGQGYKITTTACPTTLANVNAAYDPMTAVPTSTSPTSADFGLAVGLDLSNPVQRCMIIANCDPMAPTVCSYQLYEVTFK